MDRQSINMLSQTAPWALSSLLVIPLIVILILTNELYVVMAAAGICVLAISTLPKIRMFILISLLPLVHAGFGLKGFGGFGLFDVYAALFILIFLWRLIVLDGFSFSTMPVFPLALIMFLAFIPSVMNSISMTDTTKAFAQFLFSVLLGISFFFYLLRQNDERFVRQLLVMFVVVATGASIYGLYEASRSSIIGVMTGRAFFTLFGDVNYFASFLLMALAIAIGFILISKSMHKKILFSIASLLLSLSIISTVSRSALAVLLVVWIAYLGFLFSSQRGLRKFIGPAIVLIVFGLVGVLLLTDIGTKVVDLFTLSMRVESVVTGKDASVDQRITILGVGMRVVESNPWIGVGFGSFEKAFSSFQGAHLSTGFERSAHNTYLRIMAETGIVGLLASFAFFLSMVLYFWRTYRVARDKDQRILAFAILVSIISFLVMSATLDQLFEPHFWVIAAVGIAHGEIQKKLIESPNTKSSDHA